MTEIAEADEIEPLRQQLEASHQTSDLNANALEETQAELIKLRQQAVGLGVTEFRGAAWE